LPRRRFAVIEWVIKADGPVASKNQLCGADHAPGPNPSGALKKVPGLGRRAWLFAGSDRGGERAAAMYTLIATAKLNGVDSQAWLADVLRRIADHPAARLYELLPWHWQLPAKEAAAA